MVRTGDFEDNLYQRNPGFHEKIKSGLIFTCNLISSTLVEDETGQRSTVTWSIHHCHSFIFLPTTLR